MSTISQLLHLLFWGRELSTPHVMPTNVTGNENELITNDDAFGDLTGSKDFESADSILSDNLNKNEINISTSTTLTACTINTDNEDSNGLSQEITKISQTGKNWNTASDTALDSSLTTAITNSVTDLHTNNNNRNEYKFQPLPTAVVTTLIPTVSILIFRKLPFCNGCILSVHFCF